MHRFFILALILPLFLALIGPKIAYSAVLSTDGSPTPSQGQNSALAPQTESIKQGAQNLMNKAQNELQQGATKAVDTANQALKDEISRQANQQVQNTEKGLLGVVQIFKDNAQKIAKAIDNKAREIANSIVNYVIKIFHLNRFKPHVN